MRNDSELIFSETETVGERKGEDGLNKAKRVVEEVRSNGGTFTKDKAEELGMALGIQADRYKRVRWYDITQVPNLSAPDRAFMHEIQAEGERQPVGVGPILTYDMGALVDKGGAVIYACDFFRRGENVAIRLDRLGDEREYGGQGLIKRAQLSSHLERHGYMSNGVWGKAGEGDEAVAVVTRELDDNAAFNVLRKAAGILEGQARESEKAEEVARLTEAIGRLNPQRDSVDYSATAGEYHLEVALIRNWKDMLRAARLIELDEKAFDKAAGNDWFAPVLGSELNSVLDDCRKQQKGERVTKSHQEVVQYLAERGGGVTERLGGIVNRLMNKNPEHHYAKSWLGDHK